MQPIRKVGVVGAGIMGSGIAAQVANAGVPVILLDVVAKDTANRNAIAEGAIENLVKAEPAALMSKRSVRLVSAGNIEDDLENLAECDWIIEAVVERLEVKQALYRQIENVRRPGTAVSSNTSTLPLWMLVRDMPEGFARDFLITHFFNPPRYMRLVEVVAGESTQSRVIESVSHFADVMLGKSVVRCKDRPGFIANRLGTYWITLGVTEAIAAGLRVEEADAVVGRPMGIPKTGIFGLLDLVGLDLVPHVNAGMALALPKSDAFHAINRELPLISRMIAEGRTGRKGKGGFYRLSGRDGRRVREAIDLASGEYRPLEEVELPEAEASDLRALLDAPGRLGRYAWRVFGQTLAYAASLLPEVADDIIAVDEAMRLGYNWKWGPFELIDRLGVDWVVQRLQQDDIAVPQLLTAAGGRPFYRVQGGRQEFLGLDGDYRPIVRPEGVLLLADLKLRSQPLARNRSAALWDIGDGIACFEFTTTSNALDDAVIALLGESIEIVSKRFKALVIYNEGENFSLGANLGLALFAANIAAWSEIEKLVAAGQRTYRALKYAPFPVVSAPSGMALGGGCEILLYSDAVQAHAETYAGLVECGVGLIPGWGGTAAMLERWSRSGKLPKGPMPAAAKVFEIVSTATVAKSAAEAKELLFLRPDDGITMNRNRLLADAKARAVQMVPGYRAPEPSKLTLPGPSGRIALEMAAQGFARRGLATANDVIVASTLAEVLSGGATDLIDTTSEQHILELERAGFMRLVKQDFTLARIEHTLETGKPLRN
jgi:3-hydroxyacyl-CoA dehydrogenase